MFKRVFAFLMCLLLLIGMVPMVTEVKPANAAGTNLATKTARRLDASASVKDYYTEIKIDPYIYYDVSEGKEVEYDEDDFLDEVVSEYVLDDWVDVAAGCFNDAGNSASLPYSFTKKFLGENTDHKCFGDIRKFFKGYRSLTGKDKGKKTWRGLEQGSKSRDSLSTTGLQKVRNLKSARKAMANEIAKWIDHKPLTASKLLERGPKDSQGDGCALLEMKEIGDMQDDSNSGPVYYDIVTSISEKNSKYSNKYAYNSFGIAFYDFQICPISSDQGDGNVLPYKSSADDCGYDTVASGAAAGVSGIKVYDNRQTGVANLAKNDTKENDTKTTVSFTQSTTTSVSQSKTTSESIDWGMSVGASFKSLWKLPVFGDTEIDADISTHVGKTFT